MRGYAGSHAAGGRLAVLRLEERPLRQKLIDPNRLGDETIADSPADLLDLIAQRT